MIDKIETVSRRKAFSILGGAIIAIPVAVLAASNAEAQTPGMERREDRRDIRQDRREDRRDNRQTRRDDRHLSRDQPDKAPATVGQGTSGQTKQAPTQNK
jgi:hypothetical protein